MLRDEHDEPIGVGCGVRKTTDETVITGNARFETVDGKSYAMFRGQRIPNTAKNGVSITGTASTVHACDWDGDSDLDLLVGHIGGGVYLVPNVGSRTDWRFTSHRQLRADGQPLMVTGDSGPFTADWDGDGDLDLLVGGADGSVSLFTNTGSSTAPELATAETLVPGLDWTEGPGPAAAPRSGRRAKICVTDWNGDGRLDLLLGDYARQVPTSVPDDALAGAELAAARTELATLEARYAALVQRLFGPDREKNATALAAITAELKELTARRDQLRDRLPPEFEVHGWVWLLLRK